MLVENEFKFYLIFSTILVHTRTAANSLPKEKFTQHGKFLLTLTIIMETPFLWVDGSDPQLDQKNISYIAYTSSLSQISRSYIVWDLHFLRKIHIWGVSFIISKRGRSTRAPKLNTTVTPIHSNPPGNHTMSQQFLATSSRASSSASHSAFTNQAR